MFSVSWLIVGALNSIFSCGPEIQAVDFLATNHTNSQQMIKAQTLQKWNHCEKQWQSHVLVPVFL